jgi:hypothetical protein
VLIGTGTTLALLVAGLASYAGLSLYRIDHAVHHIEVPAALLAQGRGDLLTLVKGPHHSEEAYLFHTLATHTNILVLPTTLAIKVNGRTVPLSSLNLHAPDAIISGLRALGIPVSRYVGVDLHTVNANSSLGRLATGKLSVTTLISNPTGTASLLEAVASHVYLGPNTAVSALLELMHVPTSHPVHVPTSRNAQGRVVLASPYLNVLRNFL